MGSYMLRRGFFLVTLSGLIMGCTFEDDSSNQKEESESPPRNSDNATREAEVDENEDFQVETIAVNLKYLGLFSLMGMVFRNGKGRKYCIY
ncbi:hypothetical protein ACE1TI_11250 [Alteribacillus sp. JSM 102045]|uniref:hypothetical protein n=1 Tax=Alteribacillus sp. JSM 102045 TaxID=1562101 RepID=UPI0035C2264D